MLNRSHEDYTSEQLIKVVRVKKDAVINVFENPFKINPKLATSDQEEVSLAGAEGGDGYMPSDSPVE